MEAMDKSGFSNFKPEIEELLLNIEREETKHQSNKKKKADSRIFTKIPKIGSPIQT